MGLLFLGFTASVLSTVFLYVPPVLIGEIIDLLVGEQRETAFFLSWFQVNRELLEILIWAGLLCLGATLIGGTFNFLQGWLYGLGSEKLAKSLRDQLYSQIQNLPFSTLSRAPSGDWIQRATSDLDNVRRFFTLQLPELLRSLILLVVTPLILFQIHPGLTLIANIVVPFIVIFSVVFFQWIEKAFTKAEEAEAVFTGILQENLDAPGVVKAFGAQGKEWERFSQANRDYRDFNMKVVRYFSLFWGSTDFLSLGQIGLVFIVGGLWVLDGSLEIGVLVLFVLANGILLWPIRQLGRTLGDMSKAVVSLKRIGEIQNLLPEAPSAKGLKPEIRGPLSVKDLSFSYDWESTQAQRILDGVSFDLQEGESLAILGATGSGKSTLVNILGGYYEYQGQINLGGVELRDIEKYHLRRGLGFVLQAPYIYGREVHANITMRLDEAKDGAHEEAILEASRQAHFHPVLQDLSHGLKTRLGEFGVNLSGGQRQRLALARAFLGDPRVLVLDDATSALDLETEAKVQRTLADKRSTTILVSHRSSTALLCDKVLYLGGGKVLDYGEPKLLKDQPGPFRELYLAQKE
jgi:ATP-binding cassette subfamily B protein